MNKQIEQMLRLTIVLILVSLAVGCAGKAKGTLLQAADFREGAPQSPSTSHTYTCVSDTLAKIEAVTWARVAGGKIKIVMSKEVSHFIEFFIVETPESYCPSAR